MPMTWTPENNHKILLYLLKRIETKNIDVDNLAALFEGATPKALREQIAKLRRESKLIDDGPENPILPSDNNPPTTASTDGNNSSPTKASAAAAGKPRGRPKKSAKNVAEDGGPVANGKGGKTGGKGKRKRGGSEKGGEEGYGGDVEEEGEGGVKKVKSEEVDGEGEEKGLGEGAFMVEEVEGEGEEEEEEEGREMVEA